MSSKIKNNNSNDNNKHTNNNNNDGSISRCKICNCKITTDDIEYTYRDDICYPCWRKEGQTPKKPKADELIIITEYNDEMIKDILTRCGINIDSQENNHNKRKRNNRDSCAPLQPPPICLRYNDEEDIIDTSKFDYEWLGKNIKTIKDLINLGKSFNPKKRKRHNMNLQKLNKLVEPLEELDNMIGLEDFKSNLFDQIIFYLQELDVKNIDMLHTVIEGPPGVGKTELSHILAKIYKSFGFLKNSKVTSVKRDDLIAAYLGQTAIKTKKKIEEALGGVLFIDEAYSLGSVDGRDSYSKEAIDILTSYLSEHPHDLICIVAGYKHALQKCFFSLNEGLERRFNYRFTIENYSPNELRLIFFKIIKDNKWKVDEKSIKVDKFKEHIKYFKFNGGDMLTLFGFCKKAHSSRLLGIEIEKKLLSSKKKINNDDFECGLKMFINTPNVKSRVENLKLGTMYV